jgi:F-type H+-transporting ATPase subunit b
LRCPVERQELDKARKEAQEMIAKAHLRLEKRQRMQIISEAKNTAAVKVTEKAQEEIQREKEQALADIRNEVASLAILAAGRVLGKTMTVEEHRELVDKYIQEVGGIQ